MDRISFLIKEMINYNIPDLRRINHALKVYGISRAIACGEGVSWSDMEILEAAAILHDIGIHKAEEMYNSASGMYQELLGPDVAKPMLEKTGFSDNEIKRINFIISNHHAYSERRDFLLRILIEADFIVNIDEGDFSEGTDYAAIRDKNFVTKTGTDFINRLIIK